MLRQGESRGDCRTWRGLRSQVCRQFAKCPQGQPRLGDRCSPQSYQNSIESCVISNAGIGRPGRALVTAPHSRGAEPATFPTSDEICRGTIRENESTRVGQTEMQMPQLMHELFDMSKCWPLRAKALISTPTSQNRSHMPQAMHRSLRLAMPNVGIDFGLTR